MTDGENIREVPAVTLGEEATSTAARRKVALVSAAYVAAILAVGAWAPTPGPRLPGAVTVFASGMTLIETCTAFLLFAQARSGRSRPVLLLGCAYLFGGLLALGHLLTFPGTIVPDAAVIGSREAVGWLYMAWRLGFPLIVIAALLVEAGALSTRLVAPDRVDRATRIAGVVTIAATLALLAAAFIAHDLLPPQVG